MIPVNPRMLADLALFVGALFSSAVVATLLSGSLVVELAPYNFLLIIGSAMCLPLSLVLLIVYVALSAIQRRLLPLYLAGAHVVAVVLGWYVFFGTPAGEAF